MTGVYAIQGGDQGKVAIFFRARDHPVSTNSGIRGRVDVVRRRAGPE